MPQDDLFDFPCEFPIKVMGLATPDFDLFVVEMIRKHCPDLTEGAVTTRPSRGGKYLSVTVMIMAQSRQQLENLYQELSRHERVIMVL